MSSTDRQSGREALNKDSVLVEGRERISGMRERHEGERDISGGGSVLRKREV